MTQRKKNSACCANCKDASKIWRSTCTCDKFDQIRELTDVCRYHRFKYDEL